MANLLENGYLAIDTLNVAVVLDFVLLKDLDGHLVAGDDVRALLYLAKGAFTLGFADDKSTNYLAFAVLLLLRVFIAVSCKFVDLLFLVKLSR